MTQYGDRIKRLRKSKGLSQTQLAAQVGLDNSMITKIEKNQSPGSLPTLQKIAAALGVTLVELLDDSADETCATIEKAG